MRRISIEELIKKYEIVGIKMFDGYPSEFVNSFLDYYYAKKENDANKVRSDEEIENQQEK